MFLVCGIKALIYDDNPEARKMIEKLKEATKDINDWSAYNNLIKELNDYKISLIESCSC
jgi:hypothetical protein